MSRVVVLVWLGTAATRGPHEPDLASWAASRLVELGEPPGSAPLPPAAHDDARAREIEALLGEARASSFGEDPGAAESALEAATALLEAHPELPQSAWLMAEVWRIRAELVSAREPATAGELEALARAIDGTLASRFAETDPGRTAARPPPSSATPAEPSVEVSGVVPGDLVYVDGSALQEHGRIRPGKHHVLVLRRDHVAFSGWVTTSDASIRLPIADVLPCTKADLAGVSVRDGRLRVEGRVACPDWAVARAVSKEKVEIARCRGSTCGPFLPWSRGWGAAFEGPAHPAWPRRPNHDWAAWTALGILAAAATGFVLVETGAFAQGDERPTRFELGPLERPK